MDNLDKAMEMLDLGTQLSLNAIWKEQVQECIHNHTFTGNTSDTDDWILVQHTSITEPFWGSVVNK